MVNPLEANNKALSGMMYHWVNALYNQTSGKIDMDAGVHSEKFLLFFLFNPFHGLEIESHHARDDGNHWKRWRCLW